jgi:hypothetical protein
MLLKRRKRKKRKSSTPFVKIQNARIIDAGVSALLGYLPLDFCK